uniref:Secreted protein n=1 Tax=Parascaris univalens TaxID=6257 RepID=A0A915BA83_PARUN
MWLRCSIMAAMWLHISLVVDRRYRASNMCCKNSFFLLNRIIFMAEWRLLNFFSIISHSTLQPDKFKHVHIDFLTFISVNTSPYVVIYSDAFIIDSVQQTCACKALQKRNFVNILPFPN